MKNENINSIKSFDSLYGIAKKLLQRDTLCELDYELEKIATKVPEKNNPLSRTVIRRFISDYAQD